MWNGKCGSLPLLKAKLWSVACVKREAEAEWAFLHMLKGKLGLLCVLKGKLVSFSGVVREVWVLCTCKKFIYLL